eukprot:TRINITY_DN467_c0_g1_i1.p1 TRINITY_DN467_c0_g1~~TRINITY_DN467_c0_g1_i1.p1  ORF type:complete len:1282 (-),score=607.35 TRINITY_DN467_c0_g1_i1:202-4047(-)
MSDSHESELLNAGRQIPSKQLIEENENGQMLVAQEWINSTLASAGDSRSVTDVSKDLADGSILIKLLEITINPKLQLRPTGESINSNFRAVNERENINSCLKVLFDSGLLSKTSHITSQDIIAGNKRNILAVIHAIAKKSQRNPFGSSVSSPTVPRKDSNSSPSKNPPPSRSSPKSEERHVEEKTEEPNSDAIAEEKAEEEEEKKAESTEEKKEENSTKEEKKIESNEEKKEENLNEEKKVESDEDKTEEKAERGEKKKKKKKKDKKDRKERREKKEETANANENEEVKEGNSNGNAEEAKEVEKKENQSDSAEKLEENEKKVEENAEKERRETIGSQESSSTTELRSSVNMRESVDNTSSIQGESESESEESSQSNPNASFNIVASSSVESVGETSPSVPTSIAVSEPVADKLSEKEALEKAASDDRKVRRVRSHTEGSMPLGGLPIPRTEDSLRPSSPTSPRGNDSSKGDPKKDKKEKKKGLSSFFSKMGKKDEKKSSTLNLKADPQKMRKASTPPPMSFTSEEFASIGQSHSGGSTPSTPLSPSTSPASPIASNPTSPGGEARRLSFSAESIVPAIQGGGARDFSAREIYTSEIAYLKNLEILFFDYLKEAKEVCSPEEIKNIFSNISILRNFSVKLHQELESRMKKWSSTQLIGDVFLKFYPFFKAYNQYCNNYDAALECYLECMKRPEFATFCNERLAKTPNGLGPDLQSLLIMPVQRIPRYTLLLKELLSKTPSDHPDHANLTSAFAKIKEITDLVNTSIKHSDTSKHYDKVLSSVSGIMPHMLPHRKYITEEQLTFLPNTTAGLNITPQSSSSVTKTAHMWIIVFTDTLFIASGSNYNDRKLEKSFPFLSVWLSPNGGHYNSNESVFQIMTPEETFLVQAKDSNEKKKWLDILAERTNIAAKDNCALKGERVFEYRFTNTGEHYSGEWEFGKISGKGKYSFFTGKVYEGEFANGLMEGKGKMNYGGHTFYEGEWLAGEPHGEGTLTQPGVVYKGKWKHGKKRKGIIEWTGGAVFNGRFKNDKMDGEGELTCGNGDYYKGDWREGKRAGYGVFTSIRGKYEGMFLNDKRDGNGKMVWNNGDIYDGEWKNDMRHGEGKMVTIESSYKGSWSQDRKDGKGLYFLKTTHRPQASDEDSQPFVLKFDGEWKNDKRHNFGTCVRKSQDGSIEWKYEGNWVNDFRDGKGTFLDAYGTYIGMWKEDKRHGNGAFASVDNRTSCRGTWQDDFRISDQEEDIPSAKDSVRAGKGKSFKATKKEMSDLLINMDRTPELPPPKVFL